jgi:phosphatidylglycerol:prolipoprotein diacylglycerol transferase
VLTFPAIDPVAISIGGFAVRWYALAYVAGIFLGFLTLKRLRRLAGNHGEPSDAALDSLLTGVILGIILGGRLGYALLYQWDYYSQNLLDIFKIWQGGMAFHGGLIGVAAAIFIVSRQHQVPLPRLADLTATVVPIGLFFGRVANFINGELYGRVTDSPLGMVFPHAGPLPRHPSQLYEALGEGLLLGFVLLLGAYRWGWLRTPWRMTGAFLAGYGLARFGAEFFREPDAQIGFLALGLSQGQWLCLLMIMAGAVCLRPRV